MNTIHNYPVVPEMSSRHRARPELPVTREDLQVDLRMGMQLYGNDWSTSPIFRQVFHDMRMASVLFGQWYGNVEIREARTDTSHKGEAVPGWEKALQEFYDMGIYIHSLNSMAMSEISLTQQQAFRKIYGRRWLGHNEGEWDGAYIAQVARGGMAVAPVRSRQAACLHYLDWLRETYRRHHDYMVSESAMGFGCHYSAELGSRMIGLELSQSLPSNTLLLSFCRGAAKQYDLLFITSPSVFGFRGHAGLKCYPRHGQPQSLYLKENYLAGPDHGATIGLLKRLWWLSYMNGASIIEFEAGYFPCSADGEHNAEGSIAFEEPVTRGKMMANFTPIGWLHWECQEAAKRHPLRGVPYIPCAVMLPFDHGWYPQPNIYASDREHGTHDRPECVWGNIPFAPGDRQIDRFFDRIYPGYKLANWVETRDERGIVSNTPFGDSFDIILSNADDECLAKYQAVILLGDFDGFASEHLPERLEKFLRAGGTVIADNAQRQLLPADNKQCGKGRMILLPSLQDTALEPFLREYELVRIDGRPIHYLVNVTDQPDELLITLCNNSAEMSWEGSVAVKGQEIVEVEEWLAHGEAGVENGLLRCGVPANNIRVYRVKTSRPFLSLRFSNIPWEKLGYGATPSNVS